MITQNMLIGYGIGEVADLLSMEMVKLGYEVTLITGQTEFFPNEYDLISLDPLPLPLVNEYWQSHFFTDMRLALPIIKLLKNSDIVITFDPMHFVGALAKLVYGMPVIMYYFGIVPLGVLASSTRRAEVLRQQLFWHSSFKFADFIMTNSKYTWNLLPRNLGKKAIVNYHGVDHLVSSSNGVKQNELKKKLGLNDKKVLFSIGRFFTPYKGMKKMVKIFNHVRSKRKDVALLLVGRNSFGKEFERSGGVLVMTDVPVNFLVECLVGCDIYCSASLWEGFNIPLVAAQANGKPVVAFNVGAHSEVLINRKTGFLVGTVEEFEDRLEALIENDELRKQMGKNAFEHGRTFTWESCGKTLGNLINLRLKK